MHRGSLPLHSRREFVRTSLKALPFSLLNTRYSFGGPYRSKDLVEVITRYASDTGNPWLLMHGVRALGTSFTLGARGSAIQFLCSNYMVEKKIGGKNYIYFPADVEVHLNGMLANFSEAGLELETPIGTSSYTLEDLLESAKTLFSFKPTMIRENLAESLVAFSTHIKPQTAKWVSTYGEEIDLKEMIEAGFTAYEQLTAPLRESMTKNEKIIDRTEIKKFTCFATHLLYSLVVCVKNGYVEKRYLERVREQLNILVYRLNADVNSIDYEYKQVEGRFPPLLRHFYLMYLKLKFLGHAFEILNYARRHRLFFPNSRQKGQIDVSESVLSDVIEELIHSDLKGFRRADERIFNITIADLCHAYHGLSLFL